MKNKRLLIIFGLIGFVSTFLIMALRWSGSAEDVIVSAFIMTSIYFLPTVIAVRRKHVNCLPIFLVNWLLGWTFIGWVFALVWPLLHRKSATEDSPT